MAKKFNPADPDFETSINDIIGGGKPVSTVTHNTETKLNEEREVKHSEVNITNSSYQGRFLNSFKMGELGYVYINKETKEKLERALLAMCGKRVNMMCFIESILRDHIEVNRESINALIRKKTKQDMI